MEDKELKEILARMGLIMNSIDKSVKSIEKNVRSIETIQTIFLIIVVVGFVISFIIGFLSGLFR